jgi:hypothetical protein
MRRYLALEEGRLPETLRQALRNTEREGNPCGQPRHQRAQLAGGLDVPIVADVGQTDVLYWVGCAGSYEPRNQRVSQAMVQILRAAGVAFAILGEEEACNAWTATRGGGALAGARLLLRRRVGLHVAGTRTGTTDQRSAHGRDRSSGRRSGCFGLPLLPDDVGRGERRQGPDRHSCH